jgi:hypothetical protein
MRVLVAAVVVGLGLSDVARAQSAADSTSPPAASCQRSAGTAAPYARCSLSLEGDQLYLGTAGELVAHADGMRPVALSRYVVGDSARRYALRYERDARRGLWLRFVAGAILLDASVTMLTRPRCAPEQHACAATDRLFVGGLAVDLASHLYQWRAEQEGTWALGWHNRALSRGVITKQ